MQPESKFQKRPALKIRQANSRQDIITAQRLRFQVFYNEMGATADAKTLATQMDNDEFDHVCDHLLVTAQRTENSNPELCVGREELVGTYRLLRQSVAAKSTGFYSQQEFDIAPLIARNPELSFLELGRSCITAPHRGTAVIELLWQGIWNYVRAHKIDVMFGCASFDGTDPDIHANALSLLAHQFKASDNWYVRAHADCYVKMSRKMSDTFDKRRTLLNLPPLIKGYLRLGCCVGDGAVVDHAFNTTDILVVLPVSSINPRYFAHFGAPTS